MPPAYPDDPEFEPESEPDGGDPWRPDPPWEPDPEPTPWHEYERERDRLREQGRDPGRAEWVDHDADGLGLGGGGGATGAASHAGPPHASWSRPHATADAHFGPAYLAAAAVVVVLFAMGLLTVGQHARSPLGKSLLAIGSGLLVLGLALLALAAWLVRHVDARP